MVSMTGVRMSGSVTDQFERSVSMPKGISEKREREYRELETKFKKEGRYRGREEEVAARIVNKQRAEHGETKEKGTHSK